VCETPIHVHETTQAANQKKSHGSTPSASSSSHFTPSTSQLAILFTLLLAVMTLDNDITFVLDEARQIAGGRYNGRDRRTDRQTDRGRRVSISGPNVCAHLFISDLLVTGE
jgi:hypothetical protein